MWQWCHSILQGYKGGATLEEEKEIVRMSGEAVCFVFVEFVPQGGNEMV